LQPNEKAPLPFAAPFRQLTTDMPFNWLRKGWTYLPSAPRQSLGYGIVIAVLSWIVTGIGLKVGSDPALRFCVCGAGAGDGPVFNQPPAGEGAATFHRTLSGRET